jgi:hypothetical protein
MGEPLPTVDELIADFAGEAVAIALSAKIAPRELLHASTPRDASLPWSPTADRAVVVNFAERQHAPSRGVPVLSVRVEGTKQGKDRKR